MESDRQVAQLQARLSDAQMALSEQVERADRARAEQSEKLASAETRHTVEVRRWTTALNTERSSVKRLESELQKLTREAEETARVARVATDKVKTLERDLKRAQDLTATQQIRHDAAVHQMEGRWEAQIKGLEHRASRAEALLDKNQAAAQSREKDLQNQLDTAQTQLSKLTALVQEKDDVIHDVTSRFDKRTT